MSRRALGRRVAASLARHRGRFYFIDVAPARRTDRPALGELCEAVGASPTVCHSFLQLDTVLLRVEAQLTQARQLPRFSRSSVRPFDYAFVVDSADQMMTESI